MQQTTENRRSTYRHRNGVQLNQVLATFNPISLSEMDSVALLDRTDTKFLLSFSDFTTILPGMTANYRILEIAQKRQSAYRNLYFDTKSLSLYKQHHNGEANRHKVRMREYVDSHLSFLEVKCKTNKKRTIKNRMRTNAVTTKFEADGSLFLGDHYPHDVEKLVPVLWNNFTRITLVSKHAKERLTFDIGLTYRRNGRQETLDGLVIAEVKQTRASATSDFIQATRSLGIRPSKFSKYCIGVSLFFNRVKANQFKPTLLFANKLMHRSNHDYSQ